jgi:hypothetical protein
MGCSKSGAREYHQGFNFYAKDCVGDQKIGELDELVDNADPEIVTACENNAACIIDAVLADGTLEEKLEEGLRTLEEEKVDPAPPSEEEIKAFPAPPKDAPGLRTFEDDKDKEKVASGSGDPHFKTWSGDKFDYHGECDLVLVDNPSFNGGLGLKVHIRTTRVSYFSFIETVAVQIGDDVLEFNNDVSKFLVNGQEVKAPAIMVGARKVVTTFGNGKFEVKRFMRAISIRLHDKSLSKIDLLQRQNGFPAVVLDGADTDIFQGSLGLLGDFSTGKKIARDGVTEIQDATEFALEWQVRDTEPLLFSSARYPQYPTVCVPPKKMMGNRLGMSHMKEVAEKVCSGWKEDKEDCIFDVIATRDVLTAREGSVVA